MQYSTYNNSVGKVYSYKYTPVGTECNGALSDAMAVTVRGKITDNRELVNGMQCKFWWDLANKEDCFATQV